MDSNEVEMRINYCKMDVGSDGDYIERTSSYRLYDENKLSDLIWISVYQNNHLNCSF